MQEPITNEKWGRWKPKSWGVESDFCTRNVLPQAGIKQECGKQAVEKSIRLSRGDFPLYPQASNTLVQLWPCVSGPEFHRLPKQVTGSSFRGRARFR